MIFDKIVLAGETSITLFDHKNPNSSPYISRGIDGLGPTEVNVALSQPALGIGLYIGSRSTLREITATLSLNPNRAVGQTLESLREDVYRLVSRYADASLDFNLYLDDVEIATTPVYIKRIDVVPFGKDGLMQIVLASPSEFLFRRQALVNSSPGLSKTEPIFVNEGSAPSGFNVKVSFTAATSQFGFYRGFLPDNLLIQHSFVTGDILEIDTNIGSRGIWLYRGSNPRTSLLGGMSPESTWITLTPGANPLYTHSSTFDWVSYSHQPKYVGV